MKAGTAGKTEDLKIVVEQEATLLFACFDEQCAFEIGCAIRASAIVERQGIVVDVRLWDRQLFHAALPGSTAATAEWARRKLNTVRMFQKSSYRMALEQQREDRTFPPGYGLDPADYVLAGGAFPIHVQGVGVVGAIAVSGLSQRADHQCGVAALCEYLGKDKKRLAFDPA
ncbi:heme-degrading domain-containing protein [Mesorhizobium sp. B4-1-4]|uniref:heme-degrading domain-containing protein n=1 Tax=Mesorhizobium sp. B4-1-4 TaxID=2589888 RepID=UPI00112A8151|nr:heme-degrading domain-containing protein [Mesorhizobium sp. B4-1-4]UCI34530.1 heme-degrading domain-containing protein [Mesorhizobium sp. B4-1-4]